MVKSRCPIWLIHVEAPINPFLAGELDIYMTRIFGWERCFVLLGLASGSPKPQCKELLKVGLEGRVAGSKNMIRKVVRSGA